jgi:hypothetical protein
MEKQKLTVKIEEVSIDSNEIYINDGQGDEGWFPIKAPAQIRFCKVGEASVTIEEGAITYARNTSQGQSNGNRGSYPNKPYNSYPKKEYKQYTQSNPIVPGNQYKEEKKVDWDKISLGKCKHQFLVEAYKLGKSLDIAERECEAWANASMRLLQDKEVPFTKEEIERSGFTEEELKSAI